MRHTHTALSVLASLALTAGLAACGADISDIDAPGQGGNTSDPLNPADPTTPDDSDEPSQPSEPANPTDPVDAPPADPIEPSDPGAADVRFDVDATQDLHRISPYIYGVNDSKWTGPTHGASFGRAGGNRYSAFNWENNASNAGSDWCHQNDGLLGGGDTPGEAVRQRVEAAHAAGASMLVTIPILDYVSADKNGGDSSCSGDVNRSANYLQTRFVRNEAIKGGDFQYPPDANDGVVYQDEFVAWLESEFPQARSDASRTIFYSMDNEPDLWSHTHARIHPNPVGYEELAERNIRFAEAVKSVAPDAKVFGSVNYGWLGLVNLQNAPDANGRDFVTFFLEEMAAAEQVHGQRMVDVLDFHWYPEATGSVRVMEDASDASTAEARMQAPRSLWDPDYVENSWVARTLGGQGIALLPRLQEKIDAAYPGTMMAVTEYYFGGGGHISGAVAEADVLGIFGREGVFAANLWHLGNTDDAYIHGAFEMYRDFDGQGGRFGDLSVRALTSDIEGTSVYASVDEANPERMVVIAINKTGQPQTAGLAVRHTVAFSKATVYQLTDGNPGPVAAGEVPVTGTNAFTYEMPAYSVSTLVLE